MALATGGSAVGATKIKSSPNAWALRTAAMVGMISTEPSGNTARTLGERIASFTFSRIISRTVGSQQAEFDTMISETVLGAAAGGTTLVWDFVEL